MRITELLQSCKCRLLSCDFDTNDMLEKIHRSYSSIPVGFCQVYLLAWNNSRKEKAVNVSGQVKPPIFNFPTAPSRI
jgi:hypothetical protein